MLIRFPYRLKFRGQKAIEARQKLIEGGQRAIEVKQLII